MADLYSSSSTRSDSYSNSGEVGKSVEKRFLNKEKKKEKELEKTQEKTKPVVKRTRDEEDSSIIVGDSDDGGITASSSSDYEDYQQTVRSTATPPKFPQFGPMNKGSSSAKPSSLKTISSQVSTLPQPQKNDTPKEWMNTLLDIKTSNAPNRCYGKVTLKNGKEVPVYLITSNEDELLSKEKGIFIVPGLNSLTVKDCAFIYAGKKSGEIGKKGFADTVLKALGKASKVFCKYLKDFIKENSDKKKGKPMADGQAIRIPIPEEYNNENFAPNAMVFAVAPDMRKKTYRGYDDQAANVLTQVFQESYRVAIEAKDNRICTVALGTGEFGFNKAKGAQIMWDTALWAMGTYLNLDAVIIPVWEEEIKNTVHGACLKEVGINKS